MKHVFSILFFVGWFFTISDSVSTYPGVKATTRIGPFASEAECRGVRQDFLDMFQAMGISPEGSTFCEEYKGA